MKNVNVNVNVESKSREIRAVVLDRVVVSRWKSVKSFFWSGSSLISVEWPDPLASRLTSPFLTGYLTG